MLYLFFAAVKGAGASDNSVIVAAITALATGFGSWLLFRGKKSQSAAEGVVEERKLLSEEWTKFRKAVDEALENCRKDNALLQGQIDGNESEIARLRSEIRALRAQSPK